MWQHMGFLEKNWLAACHHLTSSSSSSSSALAQPGLKTWPFITMASAFGLQKQTPGWLAAALLRALPACLSCFLNIPSNNNNSNPLKLSSSLTRQGRTLWEGGEKEERRTLFLHTQDGRTDGFALHAHNSFALLLLWTRLFFCLFFHTHGMPVSLHL